MARASKHAALRGNPIPLKAATPAGPATSIVWGVDQAKVVTLLTPVQAAAVFERWGVDAVIAEDLCGAPPPGLTTVAHARGMTTISSVRAIDAVPAPYPIVGSFAVSYADPPEPSLTELLQRLERGKLVEPSRPWWARAYERLVQRFGEDLIILAVCALTAAFFFGRTVWSLYRGPVA